MEMIMEFIKDLL